ncbi:sensor domain-containing diguanylate cyclase [Calidifontibacillus erzurumensis]|uniref:GGDEF domain-containing protein n=1 Tax=Calidifontibacillus erzurumensis TaxID=2741433 RepID=A0A8J8GF28_9BACI|nr:sensor domain-containing diguanylate cyclase [Calidifontibacillus erzurumensis]NSL52502.1 GGDEF domain-containing protein [Calidifontibacillus erzurumensis]
MYKKGVRLKVALSLLAVFTVFSTTMIHWYLTNQALKNILTENHLENNYRYAKKVALSTNGFLYNMQQNLGTLARIIGKEPISQTKLDEWLAANRGYYNSLYTTDTGGVIQLISPLEIQESPNILKPGMKITDPLMKQALTNKKPFISDPYFAQSGNLEVLVSHPIFDNSGNFIGVVNGTIYLQQDNSLKRILHEHDFLDESSVFVVDRTGRIIYHPNSKRINESIANHPLVQTVLQGKSGAKQTITNQGNKYFAGYAYVEQTGWGVITLTPTSVIDKPLQDLTNKIIFQSLPMLLAVLLIASFFTNHITKPINKLARFSEEAIFPKTNGQSIHRMEIKSYIYEVKQLYQHIQQHFQMLNRQIQQDGLTGLANRRAFDLEIQKYFNHKTPFSLIMLDIDRFKQVNDVHGHLVGDDVLRFLAQIMMNTTREEDLCYRYGGEEFAILLKEKDEKDAYALAERLRTTISQTPSPTGEPITISLGISSYQKDDEAPEMVIKRADAALYQSKNDGRNRTTIYDVDLL